MNQLQDSRHKKNLFAVLRAGGVVLIIQGMGLVLAFALQVLLARWLGAGEYGAYVFSFACVTIFSIVFTLGLPTSAIRFLSENLVVKRWGYVLGFMRWSILLTVISGSLAAVIGGVAINLMQGSKEGLYEVLYASMLCVPVLCVLRLNSGLSRGFGWAAWAYIPEQVGRPMLILLSVLGLQFSHIGLNAKNAVIASAVALLVLCVFQFVVFNLKMPIEVKRAKPAYDSRNWLKVSLPLILASCFMIVIDRTDIIVLGMFVGTDGVAIYNASARTAGLVVVVLVAMNSLSAAKIAALYKIEDLDGLRELIKGVVRWTFWPSVVIAAAVIFQAEEILSIFGLEFRQGKDILVILALAQLVNAGAGPVMLLMSMTGHQKKAAFVLGWAAVINLLLNLAFVPIWGEIGAAISTGLTIILWNVWLVKLVKKYIGINCMFFART